MAQGLKEKTAVMVSVSDFPMSATFLQKWAGLADHVSVWFDLPIDQGGNGCQKIKKECLAILNTMHVSKTTIQSREKWNLTNYREALLRSLDRIKPSMVIQPDSDECFDEFFKEELEVFKKKPELLLYMDYTMVTEPGFSTFKMPPKPHCKVFKWMPNMSFAIQYMGRATPRYPGVEPTPNWNVNACVSSVSRIQHYVHYNHALQAYHVKQKAERKRRGLT